VLSAAPTIRVILFHTIAVVDQPQPSLLWEDGCDVATDSYTADWLAPPSGSCWPIALGPSQFAAVIAGDGPRRRSCNSVIDLLQGRALATLASQHRYRSPLERDRPQETVRRSTKRTLRGSKAVSQNCEAADSSWVVDQANHRRPSAALPGRRKGPSPFSVHGRITQVSAPRLLLKPVFALGIDSTWPGLEIRDACTPQGASNSPELARTPC
jgi:hypothetical protein